MKSKLLDEASTAHLISQLTTLHPLAARHKLARTAKGAVLNCSVVLAPTAAGGIRCYVLEHRDKCKQKLEGATARIVKQVQIFDWHPKQPEVLIPVTSGPWIVKVAHKQTRARRQLAREAQFYEKNKMLGDSLYLPAPANSDESDYFFMPYQGKDLMDTLIQNPHEISHSCFTVQELAQISRSLVHTWQEYSFKDVVHCDIRLENCLLDRRFHCSTLIDFEYYTTTHKALKRIPSPMYMPPEFWQSTEHFPTASPSIDGYALGMVLAMILLPPGATMEFSDVETEPDIHPATTHSVQEALHSDYADDRHVQEALQHLLRTHTQFTKETLIDTLLSGTEPAMEVNFLNTITKCYTNNLLLQAHSTTVNKTLNYLSQHYQLDRATLPTTLLSPQSLNNGLSRLFCKMIQQVLCARNQYASPNSFLHNQIIEPLLSLSQSDLPTAPYAALCVGLLDPDHTTRFNPEQAMRQVSLIACSGQSSQKIITPHFDRGIIRATTDKIGQCAAVFEKCVIS